MPDLGEENSRLKVHFTKHASAMLRERGFRQSFIREAVLSPDWREAGDGNVWFAFKRVGRKVLRVAVVDEGDHQVVKTQYYDRRVR